MMWKDWFYYTKDNRRALVVLTIIAVIGVIVVVLTDKNHHFIVENNETDSILGVHEALKSDVQEEGETDGANRTSADIAISMHRFDPNEVDSVELLSLGLSPKQIRTFLNYRRKGAVFRVPEDIMRVYSLTDADIDRMLPHVSIGQQYSKSSYKRTKYPIPQRGVNKSDYTRRDAGGAQSERQYVSNKFSAHTFVDPNTADTALLRKIPGVGPVIAGMIINRREKLGGYVTEAQLLEIEMVTPDIVEWLKIESKEVKKINLSTATFKQINAHPYISYEQTQKLSRYVRLYGKIKDANALAATGIFTEAELERLLPYLEF